MLKTLAAAWQDSLLRQRYDALAPRERTLALLCLGVAASALLYFAVAEPLFEFRQTAVQRYRVAQADLAWMRANRSAATARLDGQPAGSQVRMSTINAVASEFGLPLRSMQPEAEGFSVQIEAQPFNSVILWTHALESRHGIAIQSATMDAYDKGLVNGRFSLR